MGKDATERMYAEAEVKALIAAATVPLIEEIEELELRTRPQISHAF